MFGTEVFDQPSTAMPPFRGLSATPADAHPAVRRAASRVLAAAGGHGAIREFVDALLDAAPIDQNEEGATP